jgi:hypothetical protein
VANLLALQGMGVPMILLPASFETQAIPAITKINKIDIIENIRIN